FLYFNFYLPLIFENLQKVISKQLKSKINNIFSIFNDLNYIISNNIITTKSLEEDEKEDSNIDFKIKNNDSSYMLL
ncbi:hypothetical protein, partial [Staphylococcus condimenti]|uniref:hypothetical protein n=1 Tax=Staphylococcus condimenti TaxID=70255 RepID=UPI001A90F0C0